MIATNVSFASGAKDLPRVARQLGQVTGRAVSYVSAVRRQALSFADETEISQVACTEIPPLHSSIQVKGSSIIILAKQLEDGCNVQLHQEVQASMQQLQALRSEMRSGINVFGPNG